MLISIIPPAYNFAISRYAIRNFSTESLQIFQPRMSIILPMRDEEKNVIRKLNEIISMDYPMELISILVIDSASSDRTGQLAGDFFQSKEVKCDWQIHRIEEPGKSLAVNFAIDLVDSDFFVISDADAFCRSNVFGLLANSFSDPSVGAVCGRQITTTESSDFEYRSRYNVIRLAESIRDSTPIFEGSIAAFRMVAINGCRINEGINADDSQLALISKSNGFRSIVNPSIEFWEDSVSIKRDRLVRRAQGLSRVLFRYRGLCKERGAFARIMRMNLYFYLFFPWIIFISTSLAIFLPLFYHDLHFVGEKAPENLPLVSLIVLFSFSNSTIRSLYYGVFVLMESHIRLLMGNRLHVWETNRQ